MVDKTSVEEVGKLILGLLEKKMGPDWCARLDVDEAPLEIDNKAVPIWIKHIEKFMEKSIKAACGVAYIKGHCIVDENDMRQALEIEKGGVDQYLPDV